MVTSARILATATVGIALALSLVGCGSPVAQTPSPTTSSAAPTAAAPSPAATPETVDPSSYLLEGTPGVFDANGEWSGHYGFFTDDTKTVRCDIWIFSGDSGGVLCAITPGNESKRTYAVPASVNTMCDESSSNAADGYSVGINFKVFGAATSAGFTGCRADIENDPAIVAATKVLHDNQTLKIDTDVYKYTCTVAKGVASCADSYSGASITFGLGVAQYAG
jgi:hypothetical protein